MKHFSQELSKQLTENHDIYQAELKSDNLLSANVLIYDPMLRKLSAQVEIEDELFPPVQSIRHFMYIPRCHPGRQGFMGRQSIA